MLMGHSLGVTDSYAKFTEDEMLEGYLLGIDHLTVNQNLVMISKNFKKQQEYMQNSFKDLEERHKVEMEDLRKEHREYARLSEKQELDLARGVNMLDKKLKQQESINQQLKNIFTILVEEIGFDNLTKIENTSERFLSALKAYVANNSE
jgi:hypothetical protein